jgi:lipopolysaccharide biosynthesis regulator YciM
MNILNAHIHGGDKSGGLDEYTRHAITKISNIHFAVTEKSQKRIIKMGENPSNVFFTGSPGIDDIFKNKISTKKFLNKKYGLAKTYLKKSLEESKNCVRANILLGDIAYEEKKYDDAIVYWKKIEYQQPEYLGLVMQKIISVYETQNNINEVLSILSRYYDLYKLKTIHNSLYELVLKNKGVKSAEEIARNELIQRPSLLSLDQLFQILAIKKSNEIENIELIQQTVKNSIGERRFFNCNQCGFKAKQFHWQCPGCNAWESLPSEPIDITLEN